MGQQSIDFIVFVEPGQLGNGYAIGSSTEWRRYIREMRTAYLGYQGYLRNMAGLWNFVGKSSIPHAHFSTGNVPNEFYPYHIDFMPHQNTSIYHLSQFGTEWLRYGADFWESSGPGQKFQRTEKDKIKPKLKGNVAIVGELAPHFSLFPGKRKGNKGCLGALIHEFPDAHFRGISGCVYPVEPFRDFDKFIREIGWKSDRDFQEWIGHVQSQLYDNAFNFPFLTGKDAGKGVQEKVSLLNTG
ncbi:hypothetical protein HYU13_00950 [Candidatus Woesearchaeota archaeon]|nr:hypothetical protein [Candidatus Woesearchaeota archaeon]